MSDPADCALAMAGTNYYELLEDARELQRIKAMLDAKAAWTVVENGVEARPAERVAAVLSFVEMRMVKDV